MSWWLARATRFVELSLLTGNYQVCSASSRAMMRGRNHFAGIPRENTNALVDLDRDYAADTGAGRHWRLVANTHPAARGNHRRGAERYPAGTLSVTREVRW